MKYTRERDPALMRAIEHAGTIVRLADDLGISPESVCLWRRVPASRVLEVERLTGVKRWELRPDLYPPEDYDRSVKRAKRA